MERNGPKDSAVLGQIELSGGDGAFASMRERIARFYPELSPQLRTIAEFSVANPDAVAVDTAQELAKRMAVPPSSLVRFAQTLGYRGFNELKQDFREHLMYRLAEIREREAISEQTATGSIAVVDALMSAARRDLDRLYKGLDRKQFDRAVIELVRADRIYVSAQQAAYPLGCIFHWTALSLGSTSHLLDNAGGFSGRQTELMGQDDAILAISFTPYQSAVVRVAKAHAARGGIVVAVTDTVLSPLASVARVIIEVPQQMPITAHPLVMGTCILQALAISVGETRRLAPQKG